MTSLSQMLLILEFILVFGYLSQAGASAFAFPMWPMLAIFMFNVALYVHAARDDERSIAGSALGSAYAADGIRVGMFAPRLRKASRG